MGVSALAVVFGLVLSAPAAAQARPSGSKPSTPRSRHPPAAITRGHQRRRQPCQPRPGTGARARPTVPAGTPGRRTHHPHPQRRQRGQRRLQQGGHLHRAHLCLPVACGSSRTARTIGQPFALLMPGTGMDNGRETARATTIRLSRLAAASIWDREARGGPAAPRLPALRDVRRRAQRCARRNRIVVPLGVVKIESDHRRGDVRGGDPAVQRGRQLRSAARTPAR